MASEGQIRGEENGPAASALMLRLERARTQLSSGRRELVEDILENIDEAVFMSSPELAARFKTDPATIVRTVQALGYHGFADFAQDLRGHFRSGVNPYRVMAAETLEDAGPADHVRRSVQRDLQNVQKIHDALDPDALVALGARLCRCRQVLVVGGDLERTFADYLAYCMSGWVIVSAPATEGMGLHQIRRLGKDDGLIAFGTRRCLRVPMEAVQLARSNGAFTLAITNARTTPMAQCAEASLVAPIDGESFAGSYVAMLTVINALLVACAHVDAKGTLAMLKPTEEEYRFGKRWYHEPVARGRRKRAPRSR